MLFIQVRFNFKASFFASFNSLQSGAAACDERSNRMNFQHIVMHDVGLLFISGLIAASYEFGSLITVIFVSYLGGRRRIPVWIGK